MAGVSTKDLENTFYRLSLLFLIMLVSVVIILITVLISFLPFVEMWNLVRDQRLNYVPDLLLKVLLVVLFLILPWAFVGWFYYHIIS